MIRHDVVQGTEAWLRLRMGRPTASEFSRIVTPTGKPSSQASDYVNDLLGELMLGRPLDGLSMPWMERGKRLEEEARRYYELQRDVQLETVGFCTTDDGQIGCSPDAFCGADGIVEIKCPSPGEHVGYLLSDTKTIDKKYMPQLQGQLYVTGREFVDIISYHPELPEAIIRVTRNEEFLKVLHSELQDFLAVLDMRRTVIERNGWIKPASQPVEKFDWLGITNDDLEAILAEQRRERASR